MDADIVVIGAGPAGSTAALAALCTDPRLRVLLVDRSDFPRDKACGDAIAPQALDVLGGLGLNGLLEDRTPVSRLRLVKGSRVAARDMQRPAWVVPRQVFDARLWQAAQDAGASFERRWVR